MKRILFILFLLNLLTAAFSQLSNPNVINHTNELAAREAKFVLDYKDVEGSPYCTYNFIKGVAYLKTGDYASVPLRYDIFRDEIEFQKDNKIYWLKKSDVTAVRYGTDSLILTHSASDTSQIGYYFLRSGGEYRLLSKKIIVYNPEIPAKGYAATIPASFKAGKDEFYIQSEGKPGQRVKGKKDLSVIFEGNKAALDYIKKEKINVTKPEDLEKLIVYLNRR